MKPTHFSNSGELDPRSFQMFGISAKDGESPIGYFGTGLKMAIAVIIREGRSITIKSGSKTYNFTTEPMEFRTKKFARIYCNGEPLPFTTELAKNWKEWQAYREIASNCIDEGGKIDSSDKGDTVVSVEFDVTYEDVFRNPKLNQLMVQEEGTKSVRIYDAPSMVLYHHNIRTKEISKQSLFTYDFTGLSLTEDRTFSEVYQTGSLACKAILQCTDLDMIEKLVYQTDNKWEGGLNYAWSSAEPSDELKDFVLKNYRNRTGWNKALVSSVIDSCKEQGIIEVQPFSEEQSSKLREVLAILKEIGYDVTYSIYLAKDFEHSMLAQADIREAKIYLSKNLFNKDTRYMVETVLEEYIHIKHNVHDETRAMQDVLFAEIVKQGCSRQGIFL